MANSTERVGVHSVGYIAERNNWMFREQPINDIGIDAHIEQTNEDGSIKNLIAMQIKSGPSWFEENKGDCVVFRDINERQFNYWTTSSLPCILVLFNPENNMCIWQKLSKDTIIKKKSGYAVNVPIANKFIDHFSNLKLSEITNLPEYIINYNFLLSQKVYMNIIKDGGIVKLHSHEWVNKSCGRGDIELIIDYKGQIEKYSYPYWFPFALYTDVFRKLFPWASFEADNDFYELDDISNWHESECFYDSEVDDWIEIGQSFEQFRSNLDPMRYIDHCGEVAEYMLVLGLNNIGESFLKIDKFVSNHNPYASARNISIK